MYVGFLKWALYFMFCKIQYALNARRKKEFQNTFLNSSCTQRTSVDSSRPEMNILSCFGRDKGKCAAFSVCQLGGIERFGRLTT